MEMPTITRGRALGYLAAVLIALVVGGRFLLERASAPDAGAAAVSLVPHEQGAEADAPGGEAGTPAAATPADSEERLVVHVAGAVRRPGVYLLAPGARVADAVEEAGGARPKAALDALNLAQALVDGQQVLVPRRGVASAVPAAGLGTEAAPPAPVSLSTASLEELDALPGVGPVTAQKILDYRAEHGSFASVEELDAIPGIGPARLEQLRELVVP
jgi:competence protein ComEA